MAGYDSEAAPPAWDIRTSSADGSGGWLRIGHRAWALADISDVRPLAPAVTTTKGQAAVMVVSVALGLGFALSVAASISRPKALVAGLMFLVTAATAALEVARRRPAAIHRLEILFRDGTRTIFASPGARHCDELRQALRSRLRNTTRLDTPDGLVLPRQGGAGNLGPIQPAE